MQPPSWHFMAVNPMQEACKVSSLLPASPNLLAAKSPCAGADQAISSVVCSAATKLIGYEGSMNSRHLLLARYFFCADLEHCFEDPAVWSAFRRHPRCCAERSRRWHEDPRSLEHYCPPNVSCPDEFKRRLHENNASQYGLGTMLSRQSCLCLSDTFRDLKRAEEVLGISIREGNRGAFLDLGGLCLPDLLLLMS